MRQIDFNEYKRGVSNRAFQGSTISKGLDIIFSVDVDVHLVPAEEQRHTVNEVSSYLFLKCNMEKSEYATWSIMQNRKATGYQSSCAVSCGVRVVMLREMHIEDSKRDTGGPCTRTQCSVTHTVDISKHYWSTVFPKWESSRRLVERHIIGIWLWARLCRADIRVIYHVSTRGRRLGKIVAERKGVERGSTARIGGSRRVLVFATRIEMHF
jgi:hypothetical protein